MDLNKKAKAMVAVRIKINASIMIVSPYMPKAVPPKQVKKKKKRECLSVLGYRGFLKPTCGQGHKKTLPFRKGFYHFDRVSPIDTLLFSGTKWQYRYSIVWLFLFYCRRYIVTLSGYVFFQPLQVQARHCQQQLSVARMEDP